MSPDLLVSAIDTFNKTWVRPARFNEGQFDDVSIALRERWGAERDLWVANLLELIKTVLKYPEDGADVDLEAHPDALPSYRQSIEQFKSNCATAAEVAEMRILSVIHGDEEP
jgi:hypothetical protein